MWCGEPLHAEMGIMRTTILALSDAGATEETTNGMRLILIAGFLTLLAILLIGSWFQHRRMKKATNRVICFGDSLTACGGYAGRYSDFLAKAFPECDIVNKGVGGDSIAGGLLRFQKDVVELNPKVVILELGANDFHQASRPISELHRDMEFMVASLRERGVGVIIAGVFGPQLNAQGQIVPKEYKEGTPDFGQQILDMEKELAQRYDCIHIENIQADLHDPACWEDPRHPNATGNERVAARLIPALKKLLGRDREISAHP